MKILLFANASVYNASHNLGKQYHARGRVPKSCGESVIVVFLTGSRQFLHLLNLNNLENKQNEY